MICENIFAAPPRSNIEDGASSHKLYNVTTFKEILNPKGHPNCITGSKVTAILLNGWILPVVGVANGRVCAQPAKQACFFFIRMQRIFLHTYFLLR